MLSITTTEAWRMALPGASFGLLEFSGIEQPQVSAALQENKRAVEVRLRQRYQGFTRQQFLALSVMEAYERYYKRFDKTYHVLLQLESLVMKGKDLPDVSPLVDANFSAEVETHILTAGHDVEQLSGKILLDIAGPDDQIVRMNGTPKQVDRGEMLMRDALGVCCTLIYGQDNRSPISANTTNVLYVSYAPPGVPAERVEEHLRRVEANIHLFSTTSKLEQFTILEANRV